MPALWIHKEMRRCLLNDDGTRNYYLDNSNSCLIEGSTWDDEQSAGASTAGLRVYGTFTNAAAGKMMMNVTKDFEAMILTVGSGYVDVHYPMQTLGSNYGSATSTTTSKLVDSSATFVTDGIQAGMIAAQRDLTSSAVISSVDSETQLTLASDIFTSGDQYSIMEGFESGDVVKIGTAVLDGTDGQVMVEIPKFYYGHNRDGTSSSWKIVQEPEAGTFLYYGFQDQGSGEKDYMYVGAFEGVISDREFDSPVLTAYTLGSAKLGSVAGLTPLVNGQRSEFRQVAENRGAGWHQYDQAANFALQLLFMAEQETLNSQSIYNGITDWTSSERDDLAFTPANNRALQQTGYTLRDGNASVMSGTAPDASQRFSYRGVENFYGHLWKFVDGFNVNSNQPYFCFNPADYADDTVTNYTDPALTMPSANGYIDGIHNTPYGLIPSSSGGSSSTFLCDYYYQSTGWRVALSGGISADGDLAGFAALVAAGSSSTRGSNVGSRACFR